MTFRRILTCTAFVALLTASVSAQASAQEPELVIEEARVIVGDGTVLERGTVVVAGERIVSVSDKPVEAPDARRVDVSGKTVLPGLIDAHVHLIVPPGPPDSTSWARFLDEGVPEVLQGFLNHGVTTVRSTGDIWPEVGDLRDRVATGELPGPRIVAAGPVFTAEGAHPVSNFLRDCRFCRREAREVTEPEQAREAVRELAEGGVDYIKVISDSLIVPVQIEDAVVEAIIDQAQREGLRAAAHTAEAEFMESYAEMGIDGFVHMPLEDVSRYDPRELARVLARYETPVTTTLSLGLFYLDRSVGPVLEGTAPPPKDIEVWSEHAAILAEAGVSIVVGTDWAAYPGSQHDHPALNAGAATVTEMLLLRWGGMSRHAIIQAATSNAARALEMEEEVGTLETGKLADLIVVDGNPLEDLSALRDVELVVKGGEVVAGRTERNGAETLPVHRQDWSQAQQEVWEREVAYWEAVEAADVERFMALWNEGFVGWPASEEEPVSRSDLRGVVEAWFDEVRSTEFRYDLTPLAVTVFDDIAVTFYRAKSVYGDTDGGGSSEVGRLSHVWQKQHGEWTIMAGMSAPGEEDDPSPQR